MSPSTYRKHSTSAISPAQSSKARTTCRSERDNAQQARVAETRHVPGTYYVVEHLPRCVLKNSKGPSIFGVNACIELLAIACHQLAPKIMDHLSAPFTFSSVLPCEREWQFLLKQLVRPIQHTIGCNVQRNRLTKAHVEIMPYNMPVEKADRNAHHMPGED